MRWVDTHCHLQLDSRPPDDLLERAPDVDWVVVPGVDVVSSKEAIELADRLPGRVLATAGLHPHEASEWASQRVDIEAMSVRVAAIGETGLDFYRLHSSEADQVAAFSGQIQLALESRKPLVVHCRDAFAKVHEMIEAANVGPQTLLHSWTGGRRWTRRFLDLGVTFSYSGPIAFQTGETIRLGAALVPPDRAVVETDTPYLTPPPHQGKPNEPAWVALVGAALSKVWGVPVAEVADTTTSNAAGLFGR